MEQRPEQRKKMSSLSLYFIVTMLFSIVGVCIVGKAINIIFVEGDFWRKLGEEQIRRGLVELPERGNIYSCNGELMATSAPLYYVYIDFQAGGFSKDTLNKYITPLSHALSRAFGDKNAQGYKTHIENGYASKNRGYQLINRKITYLELQELYKFPFLSMRSNISGLHTRMMVERQKPFGTLASRTIGSVYGEYEKGARNGLELQYDSLLRGEPGIKSRKKIRNKWTDIIEVEPKHGKSLVTTIDVVIQDITEKALVDKLKEIDAESGTVVVMEVETGEIRAITNMGRDGKGGYQEGMNYAVADQSEPGSTFKVASMIVALEAGVVQPGDTIDTGDGICRYAGAEIRDHNAHRGGYHRITAEQAIWYSSNVGVAKIILKGFEKEPARYIKGLKDIGIDTPLDLEIPGAGRAVIKDPSSKTWWKTSLPWISFGYETQIPPIYTLTYFNAIANDGKMVKPYFTKKILSGDDVVQTFGTKVINPSICSKSTLKAVQQMLLGVVEHGTGADVKSDIISIAGKTGTAQLSQGAGGYKVDGVASHQVSFCGYFPADNPKYTCIVVVRQPQVGEPSAGAISGGVFKNIAERIYATTVLMGIDDLPIDSALRKTPLVKNGLQEEVNYLLDELDVDYSRIDKSAEWVRVVSDSAGIALKPVEIVENLVPSVIGMGAKDAVYLLEKNGMRVSLSGSGRVTSQSIQPGVKIQKNGFISIQLK